MNRPLHYFVIIIGAPLIWGYLKLVQLTSKITITGEEFAQRERENNKGHIFVFWHNRQLLLPLLQPDDTVHCLISDSRDGDYMAAVIRLFGKQAVRGSSSRNGLPAMKNILRLLKNGEAVGIATDGPRGPAFKVKPGVVQMAQALQVSIIPVSFDATRKKVLNSWDNTFLLYPFNRIAVVYGEPIRIMTEQPVAAACSQVEASLIEAGDSASATLATLAVSK